MSTSEVQEPDTRTATLTDFGITLGELEACGALGGDDDPSPNPFDDIMELASLCAAAKSEALPRLLKRWLEREQEHAASADLMSLPMGAEDTLRP